VKRRTGNGNGRETEAEKWAVVSKREWKSLGAMLLPDRIGVGGIEILLGI
jgi:hypothetical protein